MNLKCMDLQYLFVGLLSTTSNYITDRAKGVSSPVGMQLSMLHIETSMNLFMILKIVTVYKSLWEHTG